MRIQIRTHACLRCLCVCACWFSMCVCRSLARSLSPSLCYFLPLFSPPSLLSLLTLSPHSLSRFRTQLSSLSLSCSRSFAHSLFHTLALALALALALCGCENRRILHYSAGLLARLFSWKMAGARCVFVCARTLAREDAFARRTYWLAVNDIYHVMRRCA